MQFDENKTDKTIRKFVRQGKDSKSDVLEFIHYYFLHPDLERDYTEKVARNIIEVSHSYYRTLSKIKKFHFLRAIVNLLDIALSLKFWEYQLSRNDASWYWKGIPTYFSSITHLVEPLENIRFDIGTIDKHRMYKKVILVEGESEFNFLSRIQDVTKASNLDFEIHNYEGKGNIQNLIQYIRLRNRKGIKIILTYDEDRNLSSFKKKLKNKNCRVQGNFGFRKDFEHSFPPQFMKAALDNYYKRYCKEVFPLQTDDIKRLRRRKESLLFILDNENSVSISKPKLATILGQFMGQLLLRYWNEIVNEKNKRFNAEIYRFANFIIKN